MKRFDFHEILSLDNAVQCLNKPLIIYGTGKVAEIFYDYCLNHQIEVLAVCDSNTSKLGLPFKKHKISLFENVVEQYSDFSVIIATGPAHFEAIKTRLLETVSPDRLIYKTCNFINTQREEYVNMIFDHAEELSSIYETLADDESKRVMLNVFKGNVSGEKCYFEDIFSEGQYFNDLTRVTREKCFVDAGAFTGDTLKEFVTFTKGEFDQAYCFEPFLDNYKKLEETRSVLADVNSRINLVNKALYSSEGRVNYDPVHTDGSQRITTVENDLCYFETIALDQLDIQDVSFIKMDIEGSELEALKGARNTILKSKPKLAICVYHKAMDLIDITRFIHELNLDYKFYLRHHNDFALENLYHCETVLYAL